MTSMRTTGSRAGGRRWAASLALAAVFILAACQSIPTPQSFNQSAYVAEAMTAATARTCIDLSQRNRIPLSAVIRCREIVVQAGGLIDSARVVGGADGQDRLVAVQRLLADLESDLRAREAKQ